MYNLKAVVQHTGIPASSLRAWEKRYGLPAPVRKPNGHRVYTRSDVEKLLRIKALMAQGMTVSQACAQLAYAAAPAPAGAGEVERIRLELSAALGAVEPGRAYHALSQALDLLTLPQVVLRVIRPLLPALSPFGATWLRFRLGAMLQVTAGGPGGGSGGPVALVLNPRPSDLRPLMAAVLLSRRGHRVIYVEGIEAPGGLQPDLTIDPRRWRDDQEPEQLFQ
jgi:MerR family transcriptional regulator, light-induced transcriptional regulator